MKRNYSLLQLKEEDFAPASLEEKESLVIMRKSVSFWKDGLRRLWKNKIAMASFFLICVIVIFAYIVPNFWPYDYAEQFKGAENLAPGEKLIYYDVKYDYNGLKFHYQISAANGTIINASKYSVASSAFVSGDESNMLVGNAYEKEFSDSYRCDESKAVGFALEPQQITKAETQNFSVSVMEKEQFPFIAGTDKLGRDYAVRLMMGTCISLTVGLVCAFLVLLVGSVYGAVAAYAGGWVDNIMMRITDILYTIPDVLIIILLAMILREPLETLAQSPAFKWMETVGPNLIAIFIVFVLLYWVGMARITRSQILVLKEAEYVTAARASGASNARIIRKHLLTNCIGTLIVTTTLQIPSAIFTESYLSFLGLGVAVPMPSLGSLATDAVKGMNTYPHLLFFPAVIISVTILAFNLFGDGLRDAFDPKLKN